MHNLSMLVQCIESIEFEQRPYYDFLHECISKCIKIYNNLNAVEQPVVMTSPHSPMRSSLETTQINTFSSSQQKSKSKPQSPSR